MDSCICKMFGTVAFLVVGAQSMPTGVMFPNETRNQINDQRNLELRKQWSNGDNSRNGNYCDISSSQDGGLMALPPCYQECNEWCWAASSAVMANYYDGTWDCSIQCQGVSYAFGAECCPSDNWCYGQYQQENECDAPGTDDNIAYASGMMGVEGSDFQEYGPLDQDSLDFALNSGRPVIFAVAWSQGGGHALSIGGCVNGLYLVHDPWGWYDNWETDWQQLSYDQILSYVGPDGGDTGTWRSSVVWNLDGYHAKHNQHAPKPALLAKPYDTQSLAKSEVL